jgi:hypothetical protein
MEIKIYAHASKDSNYDVGSKAGLKGDALRMFCHAGSEVELILDVNEISGLAKIIKVDGKAVLYPEEQ